MRISIEKTQELIKNNLTFSFATLSEIHIKKETYEHISVLCWTPAGEGLGFIWTTVYTGKHRSWKGKEVQY